MAHLHADAVLPAHFLESLQKGMQKVFEEDGTLEPYFAFILHGEDRRLQLLEKLGIGRVGLIEKRFWPQLLTMFEDGSKIAKEMSDQQGDHRMPTILITDEGWIVLPIDYYTVTSTSDSKKVYVGFTCHRCRQAMA